MEKEKEKEKKVGVEVCLISGRGLRRSSSLWKLQWYAVGWINPDHKYCTKIDASGTSNPIWKTGFSTWLELDDPDSALHVQVYSRDPIFLRESLFASATVPFKEFLDKYTPHSPLYEVSSFQLRKPSSNKSLGFVDVSIRISQHNDEDPASSYLGGDEGFNLDNLSGALDLDKGKSHQTETNYQTASTSRATYQQPPPPPPQPPSNVGYIPNFFPITSNYANTPTVAGRGVGMGLGAGALAAGALIFGDDFMPTYPPF